MTEIDEGRVIGNYRVVRILGQGGMGTVYEVEHVELGTHYALKTFTFDPEDDCAELLLNKFREEAKLLSRIRHQLVARAFDLTFDRESSLLYYVMDLVLYKDGESYSLDEMETDGLDEDVVYGWFRDACEALDYVHSLGIVHRDVKLQNFLLNSDNRVVLSDFGISRIFGAEMKKEVAPYKTMRIKRNGKTEMTVLGTEHYIAPEVQRGHEATPAADAYSLGVMFFRLFTGKWADEISNAQVDAYLHGFKYRWYKVIPELVKLDPDQRPSRLRDLVGLLRRDDPAQPPPPRAPRPEKAKPARKRRSKARENLLAAGIALAVVGMLAAVGYLGWRHMEERRTERDRRVAALAQKVRESEEAERKAQAQAEAARKAKEAEERRLAEERAKRDAERKAALAKRRQDEENACVAIAKNANAAVRETPPDAKPAATPPERKRREFVQEAVAVEEKDYGPIPDKRYAWLANGNADAPQKQSFQLANGAKLELMPQKAATFYMRNNPEDLTGWHKVTLTRPFWMTRTCVTVDQWREFAPSDCEDCREIEKALDGKALLYIRLSRKSVDEFCAYLTAKYAKQLPKGYVFRLPSEAEWEYALDEWSARKYERPGEWWADYVLVNGKTFQAEFAAIRKGQANGPLGRFKDYGHCDGLRYRVGGLSMPLPSGVMDMYGERRPVLDILENKSPLDYAQFEIDPLRWGEGIYDEKKTRPLLRDFEKRRTAEYGSPSLCHIVLGPDLVGEKAWRNKRETANAEAVVPRQTQKFDAKKIPNKISRPREITLKRVGGIESVFCAIPKGKFSMSNIDGQAKASHRVELTRPFWMSKFCVTAAEWREYAPHDFYWGDIRLAERLFPKNPVCVSTTYRRWEAYCGFLNTRYGHLLPDGYVFRLPTEAEWEWAFVADEKGDVRKMSREAFHSGDDRHRKQFKAMLDKARAPKDIRYSSDGYIGAAYVGGRTARTGFGVYDIYVPMVGMATLDAYDAQGLERDDGSIVWRWADSVRQMHYEDRETDPVVYAGRTASFYVQREMSASRWLRPLDSYAYAHIVIAPDILKPLKEKEVAPFPKEDYGGVFIGDHVTRADQSSRLDNRACDNSDERLKRMLSLENVIVDHFDKGKFTIGFRTRREESPWILLDLGARRTITGISIDAFCVEGPADRIRTRRLCVWVSDDGKHEKLVDKEELMRQRYRIDLRKKNVKGRYVRIGREPKTNDCLFSLDKVVIYGKER